MLVAGHTCEGRHPVGDGRAVDRGLRQNDNQELQSPGNERGKVPRSSYQQCLMLLKTDRKNSAIEKWPLHLPRLVRKLKPHADEKEILKYQRLSNDFIFPHE